jgi:hypothetical protein
MLLMRMNDAAAGNFRGIKLQFDFNLTRCRSGVRCGKANCLGEGGGCEERREIVGGNGGEVLRI